MKFNKLLFTQSIFVSLLSNHFLRVFSTFQYCEKYYITSSENELNSPIELLYGKTNVIARRDLLQILLDCI